MKTYYCPRHNITVTVDGNRRVIDVPLTRFAANDGRCALLTARQITPGRLERLDAYGRKTGQFCDIEER